MQKSIEGLLRNLLHSMLCTLSRLRTFECYAAVKEICGPRWTSMNNRAPWVRGELKRVLTHLASTSTTKCLFFIDALDECEPQDALNQLANEILWMSRLPNVKLCASCRPWNVFARKFDRSKTLRIDLLTYRDMAKYVEERLVDAEAQCGVRNDFCKKSRAAKKLVHDVTHAAEGVFLWIELVTKALCSEIRKGRSITQLHQIVHEFPGDLDSYFNKLVFDRIGRTRRNICDTAAALKLALEIHRNEQNHRTSFPISRSYMNFWLLLQGHLQRGFSWEDHGRIEQHSVERMMKDTASFLEETCKDLLGPLEVDSRQRVHEWEINFLHRTVYDFLSDGPLSIRLERDAPEHFLDPGFVAELARLRCMCLLEQKSLDCVAICDVFSEILECRSTPLFYGHSPRWVITCESFAVSQMQANCICLGLDHLSRPDLLCISLWAGLSGYQRKIVEHLPHLALGVSSDDDEENFLHLCLNVWTIDTKTRIFILQNLDIIREALECGCHPDDISCNPAIPGCNSTSWEIWLAKTYWWSQEHDRNFANEEIQRHKRAIGGMVSLLLEYGADPHCTICLENHSQATHVEPSGKPKLCRWIALGDLLPLLVPQQPLTEISNLMAACSDEATISTLRRNQYRRATRSLVRSEQNLPRSITDGSHHSIAGSPWKKAWNEGQRKFLRVLTCQYSDNRLEPVACLFCSRKSIYKILMTWCVDCRGIAYLCHECCKVFSSKTRSFEPPCRVSLSSKETDIGIHTRIVVARDALLKDWAFMEEYEQEEKEENDDDLTSRYGVAQAITVLKEWYARNPI